MSPPAWGYVHTQGEGICKKPEDAEKKAQTAAQIQAQEEELCKDSWAGRSCLCRWPLPFLPPYGGAWKPPSHLLRTSQAPASIMGTQRGLCLVGLSSIPRKPQRPRWENHEDSPTPQGGIHPSPAPHGLALSSLFFKTSKVSSVKTCRLTASTHDDLSVSLHQTRIRGC